MDDIRFALALVTLACESNQPDALEGLAAMTAELREHDSADNIAMALALVAAQLVNVLDEIDPARQAGHHLLRSFGLTTERLSTIPGLIDGFRRPVSRPEA